MKGVLLAPAWLILRCSRVEALIPGARVFGAIGRMAELRSGLRQRVPQSSPEDNHGEHGGYDRKVRLGEATAVAAKLVHARSSCRWSCSCRRCVSL